MALDRDEVMTFFRYLNSGRDLPRSDKPYLRGEDLYKHYWELVCPILDRRTVTNYRLQDSFNLLLAICNAPVDEVDQIRRRVFEIEAEMDAKAKRYMAQGLFKVIAEMVIVTRSDEMTDIFEQFFAKIPDGVEVVTCPRCAELCKITSDGSEEARLLRKTTDRKRGLCPNCAVASWLKAQPFAKPLLEDPSKLLLKPLQEQFVAVMKAGKADMKPEEISWELVVQYWNLPFPK
jgi:hypothetical protein